VGGGSFGKVLQSAEFWQTFTHERNGVSDVEKAASSSARVTGSEEATAFTAFYGSSPEGCMLLTVGVHQCGGVECQVEPCDLTRDSACLQGKRRLAS